MEIRELLRRWDRKYKETKKKGTDELKKEVKRLGREIQKQLRHSYWQCVSGLL